MGQLLTAGFYLVLAIAATAVNWRRRSWIAGAALIVYSLVSSITFFLTSFEWMVLREVALATLMATVAFELWILGEAPRSNQVIMGLCILDIGFCGVLCLESDPSNRMQWLFAVVVNVLFVGMCAAVAASGIRHGVRRWFDTVDAERPADRAPALADLRAPTVQDLRDHPGR